MALSFAEKMDEITVMVDGCTANQEQLVKRGLTPELMTRFIEQHGKVRRVNSDQEALKARLKEKTAELEAECAILFEIAAEMEDHQTGNAPGVVEGIRHSGQTVNERKRPVRRRFERPPLFLVMIQPLIFAMCL